jgi:hypothetical protein
MTALAAVVLISDAIVLLVLTFHASPDFADHIDEHQGNGTIRDDWALEPLLELEHQDSVR